MDESIQAGGGQDDIREEDVREGRILQAGHDRYMSHAAMRRVYLEAASERSERLTKALAIPV